MVGHPRRQSPNRIATLLGRLGMVLLGGLIVTLVGVAVYLNSRPALHVWHTVHLEQEFTVASDVEDFAAYLALEDRLFEELQDKVYDVAAQDPQSLFQRFHKGSLVDPTSASVNWNRSFELASPNPSVGVLLLHGLSDSPYSLRDLGKQFHDNGAHVLGLRVPGHGTAPSGLTTTTFDDMAAAVTLAMQHMRGVMGERDIYIVGYSNGGALAVHYATRSLQEANLPRPSGLILMSPEIGVSPAAELAGPLSWIGRRLGIQSLAWASIGVEYDPYKYNSFALRADLTAWNATQAVKTQLSALQDSGDIAQMPPILAFQSAADATVEASVLITELFDNLQGDAHHLVLFDANQYYGAKGFLLGVLDVNTVLQGEARPYDVSVLTNASPTSLSTVLKERPANTQQVSTTPLDIAWPSNVYSLAHIALPFSPTDPLYGSISDGTDDAQSVRFGDLPIYGEHSAFRIPASGLIRQHSNPFYSVISEMSLQFAVR